MSTPIATDNIQKSNKPMVLHRKVVITRQNGVYGGYRDDAKEMKEDKVFLNCKAYNLKFGVPSFVNLAVLSMLSRKHSYIRAGVQSSPEEPLTGTILGKKRLFIIDYQDEHLYLIKNGKPVIWKDPVAEARKKEKYANMEPHIPETQEAPAVKPKPEPKPEIIDLDYSEMTKKDLKRLCKEKNITFRANDTNEVLIKKLEKSEQPF